jgi:hypothetical protein
MFCGAEFHPMKRNFAVLKSRSIERNFVVYWYRAGFYCVESEDSVLFCCHQAGVSPCKRPLSLRKVDKNPDSLSYVLSSHLFASCQQCISASFIFL